MEPQYFNADRGGEPKSLSDAMSARLPPVESLEDAELLWPITYNVPSHELRERLAAHRRMLADAADGTLTRLTPGERSKARDRVPKMEREIEEAVERETRAARRNRPKGCWCLGLGGRGSRGLLLGIPVQIDAETSRTKSEIDAFMVDGASGRALEVAEQYCTCPEGIARRETEGRRRADWLAGYNRGKDDSDLAVAWERAGLPPMSVIYSLDQYPQDTPDQRATIDAVKQWRPPRWLYLEGQMRRGKTTIAVSLGQKALRKGYTVKFWRVSSLLDHLRAGFEQDVTQEQLMDELLVVDFLILDDFGAMASTEYAADRLFVLLDGRLQTQKATIFTSNYPLGTKEGSLVSALLGSKADPSVQLATMAHRINARVKEMADVVEVKGPPLSAADNEMQELDW